MTKKSKLTPPPDLPKYFRLLDTNQVSALLGVSPKTVRRMKDAGKLPQIVRVGRLIRWRESDIIQMIRGM